MIQTTTHDAGITIVRPGVERLTAANAKTFKDDVSQLIKSGASHLVIDLGGVSFVDSSGLGALVGIYKLIGLRGDLAVSGLQADVAQMFRICRMDGVFRIFASVEQACENLAGAL
ncbi:STAS domain-containing protein [Yoonia sp. 208BN28-4]|uniref:STAS domain-containing protein n=1 Tax=Yoonia sp. 208BN28-4 TaxID=3126505 RepID=UPI00309FB32D